MIWLIAAAGIVALALLYWLFASPTSQFFGPFPYRGKTGQKLVALTFDDGPNEPYTSRLLDLLAKHQVQATFFVVGNNVRKYPQVVKQAAGAGHIIGNHSLSHRFRNYFTSLDFASEITANQQVITETIGQTPALFRPPWLFRTPWILSKLNRQYLQSVSGLFVNNWEIFQPSAERIANTAFKRTEPGTILIFHDGYNAKGAPRSATIKAVDLLISRLKAEGYQFTTPDELLGCPAYLTA